MHEDAGWQAYPCHTLDFLVWHADTGNGVVARAVSIVLSQIHTYALPLDSAARPDKQLPPNPPSPFLGY